MIDECVQCVSGHILFFFFFFPDSSCFLTYFTYFYTSIVGLLCITKFTVHLTSLRHWWLMVKTRWRGVAISQWDFCVRNSQTLLWGYPDRLQSRTVHTLCRVEASCSGHVHEMAEEMNTLHRGHVQAIAEQAEQSLKHPRRHPTTETPRSIENEGAEAANWQMFWSRKQWLSTKLKILSPPEGTEDSCPGEFMIIPEILRVYNVLSLAVNPIHCTFKGSTFTVSASNTVHYNISNPLTVWHVRNWRFLRCRPPHDAAAPTLTPHHSTVIS